MATQKLQWSLEESGNWVCTVPELSPSFVIRNKVHKRDELADSLEAAGPRVLEQGDAIQTMVLEYEGRIYAESTDILKLQAYADKMYKNLDIPSERSPRIW